MTDEQLRTRLKIKRTMLLAVLLLLLSSPLIYFKVATDAEVEKYESDKAQEASLQTQADQLEQQNLELQQSIDENGRELVSFSEDKLKYINLASELSEKLDVRLNKLSVSDIWTDGQMSVMTTDIEIDGDMVSVSNFVRQYCGGNTSRINKISCRPIDRYPWLARTIDGDKVLSWFDLTDEESSYEQYVQENDLPDESNRFEAGIPVAPEGTEIAEIDYITIGDMFADKTMRTYLQIDFLGRN